MKVLILMAGSSKYFDNSVYKYPKNLIEINGQPLMQYIIKNITILKEAEFIFVIRMQDSQKWHLDSSIKLLIPNAKIIKLSQETKGAACSSLFAIDYINNNEPLLISNGDQILNIDYTDFINKSMKYDASTVIFKSIHPRWSYVKIDDKNIITEASEKKPISNYATAGTYFFKKGKDFINATYNMIKKNTNVNGNYYICPTFNEMVLKNKIIFGYKINKKQYHQITTPQELEEFRNLLKKDTYS